MGNGGEQTVRRRVSAIYREDEQGGTDEITVEDVVDQLEEQLVEEEQCT
jgi:hypothetical protein